LEGETGAPAKHHRPSPPIGTTLFISSSIAKATLAETTKELWPFFTVAMLLLIVITYIPALTIY